MMTGNLPMEVALTDCSATAAAAAAAGPSSAAGAGVAHFGCILQCFLVEAGPVSCTSCGCSWCGSACCVACMCLAHGVSICSVVVHCLLAFGVRSVGPAPQGLLAVEYKCRAGAVPGL
jgi:hypothetical protein